MKFVENLWKINENLQMEWNFSENSWKIQSIYRTKSVGKFVGILWHLKKIELNCMNFHEKFSHFFQEIYRKVWRKLKKISRKIRRNLKKYPGKSEENLKKIEENCVNFHWKFVFNEIFWRKPYRFFVKINGLRRRAFYFVTFLWLLSVLFSLF